MCQCVAWTPRNGVAAENIHAIDDHLSEQLRRVVLHNRSYDGGLPALVQNTIRVASGRIHDISERADSSEWLLNSLKFSDRKAELFSDYCVGSGNPGNHF